MNEVQKYTDDSIMAGGAAKDKPIQGKNADLLKTHQYAQSLAQHVVDCATPLTVGVQGEWGSGKTSLLNMMREEIETSETKLANKQTTIQGWKRYNTIWINTWEHSLLKTPEECLLSIIEEIINKISAVDGSWNSAQKAKSALSSIARGAVRIGATAALGSKGGLVADEMLGDDGSGNSVKVLRKTLDETIKTIVKRPENTVDRFIIFIDDLDRLDPRTAVLILELLKNIFDLNHCVFIVAIDYQVVVKGLKDKFGDPDENNEWEFRAFFDKIIQLPFMMPMANYKITNYLGKLLIGVKYFSQREIQSVDASGYLESLLLLTVGNNPRSIKRLVNSLSLIWKHYKANEPGAETAAEELSLKQLVIAFVCIQIHFPMIFELLRASPTFYDWGDDFVNKITNGTHVEDKEMNQRLQRAIEVHGEDFDAEWEQALFKIIWVKKWQRNKIVQASKVLSIVEEKLLPGGRTNVTPEREKIHSDILAKIIRLTAVTSVASTDEAFTVSDLSNSEDDQANSNRNHYWTNFGLAVRNLETELNWKTVKATMTSATLGRDSDVICGGSIKFKTSCKSSSAISIEAADNDELQFFEWLKLHSKTYLDEMGTTPVFKVGPDVAQISIRFPCPNNIAPLRKDLSSESMTEKLPEYLSWIAEKLPIIEKVMINARNFYEAVDARSEVVNNENSTAISPTNEV